MRKPALKKRAPVRGAVAKPTPRPDARTLPLMEMFCTIQGEGFHSGKPAFFIRLGGCHVGCTWCDVKESWEADRHPLTPASAIVTEALRYTPRLAVVTGGEPCMYDLAPLCDALRTNGFMVALETSGAYPVQGAFDWICVSPKKFRQPLPECLRRADELKVVVFNKTDYRWAEKNAAQTGSGCQLFLQPEYGRAAAMLPGIVQYVKENPHWRISLQIHKVMNVP